ncbi:hypothetical protein C8F01DRAFT_1353963 [Mycena amicta]|nr:hypothetical protein C8F01DRAFT_1353963 [Mycena amicta]
MESFMDSPITSDSRSLSKYTSYSYADDDGKEVLDVSAFSVEGFSDFKLDLACLSPPPSPPDRDGGNLHLPASPPSSSRRSVSFSADFPPVPTTGIGMGRPASAPRLSPRISLAGGTSTGGGTLPWTLSRYVGRGTPIDRGRRSQWVGNEADEEGLLFSTGSGPSAIRSTSMEYDYSGSHSQRSISPLAEWNYVAPPPAAPPKAHTVGFSGAGAGAGVGGRARSGSQYGHGRARSMSSLAVPVPLPENRKIKLDGLGLELHSPWAESVCFALAGSSTTSMDTPTPTPTLTEDRGPSTPTSPISPAPLQPSRGTEQDQDQDTIMVDVPLALLPSAPQPAHINTNTDSLHHPPPSGITWFDVTLPSPPSPAPGPSPSPAPSASASASVYSCESSPRERAGLAPSGSKIGIAFPTENGNGNGRAWWRRLWRRLTSLRALVAVHASGRRRPGNGASQKGKGKGKARDLEAQMQ